MLIRTFLPLLLSATVLCDRAPGWIAQFPAGDKYCQQKPLASTKHTLGGMDRCPDFFSPDNEAVYIGIFWGDYSKLQVFPYEKCEVAGATGGASYTIDRVKKEAGHCVKYSDLQCAVPHDHGGDIESERIWQSVKMS